MKNVFDEIFVRKRSKTAPGKANSRPRRISSTIIQVLPVHLSPVHVNSSIQEHQREKPSVRPDRKSNIRPLFSIEKVEEN